MLYKGTTGTVLYWTVLYSTCLTVVAYTEVSVDTGYICYLWTSRALLLFSRIPFASEKQSGNRYFRSLITNDLSFLISRFVFEKRKD